MAKHLRSVCSHLALFAGLLILLYMLLVAAAGIPNEKLAANFERSALSYQQTDAYQFTEGEKFNAIADNYADAIWLNVSWHMGKESPFTAVLDTAYYDGGELGNNAGLYLSVTADAQANTDYTRYWHGTAIFIRFAHLFTDVNGLKWMGMAALLLFALLTSVILFRRGHWDVAVLMLLSLVAVQVWQIRLSMEYQPTFVLAFALCPLWLTLERRSDRWLPLLSTVSGVLTAFFDFLTTETIAILLPLILVMAVRAKEGRLGSLKESLLLLLRCGLCWGAAYAGTFLVKWTAATLVTGENAFALALSSVSERIGGEVALDQTPPSSIFSAIAANLTVLFGGTARVQLWRAFWGTVLFLGVLASVWYLFRNPKAERTGSLTLLLLGLVVFVRYLVLNNHSYLHEFFTYRALVSPILAMLLALRLNICLPQKKKRRKR